ncbi:unnamed protein product [Gadus morhua 'NCC']
MAVPTGRRSVLVSLRRSGAWVGRVSTARLLFVRPGSSRPCPDVSLGRRGQWILDCHPPIFSHSRDHRVTSRISCALSSRMPLSSGAGAGHVRRGPAGGPGGAGGATRQREKQRRLENDAYSDLSDGEKEARFAAGIMQQFAISQATLFGWNSVDGESLGAESNQGSNGHLSEGNQDSITSRDPGLHHSSTCEVWPHSYVSQGLYCLSSSDAWEPISGQPSGMGSPAAGSFIMAPSCSSAGGGTPGEGFEGYLHQNQNQLLHQYQLQQYHNQQLLQYQQQSMDPRLHSASHSLQATPNSTIHSLGVPTHPRLADLWGGVQLGGVPLDAHQVEIVGHLSGQTADGILGGVVGGETLGEEPESEGFSEQLDEEEEEDVVTKVEEVTLTLEPLGVPSSPGTPPSSPGGRRQPNGTAYALRPLDPTGESAVVVVVTTD